MDSLECAFDDRQAACPASPLRLTVVGQIRIDADAHAKMPDTQCGDARIVCGIAHFQPCRNRQFPGIERTVAVDERVRPRQIERHMDGKLAFPRFGGRKTDVLPRTLFGKRITDKRGKQDGGRQQHHSILLTSIDKNIDGALRQRQRARPAAGKRITHHVKQLERPRAGDSPDKILRHRPGDVNRPATGE